MGLEISHLTQVNFSLLGVRTPTSYRSNEVSVASLALRVDGHRLLVANLQRLAGVYCFLVAAPNQAVVMHGVLLALGLSLLVHCSRLGVGTLAKVRVLEASPSQEPEAVRPCHPW